MTINEIIIQLNQKLRLAFEEKPGVRFYGIAETVWRIVGTEEEAIPALIEPDGEIKYIDPFDDVAPMTAYWKLRSLTTANISAGNKTYGREAFLYRNTYSVVLIVYYDIQRIGVQPDELYMAIVASASGFVPPKDFRHVLARFSGVNLNSREVYDREFIGPRYKLPANRRMIEISCTIEGEFDKNCLDKFCC